MNENIDKEKRNNLTQIEILIEKIEKLSNIFNNTLKEFESKLNHFS